MLQQYVNFFLNAQWNGKDSWGRTALTCAAIGGYLDVMKCIVSYFESAAVQRGIDAIALNDDDSIQVDLLSLLASLGRFDHVYWFMTTDYPSLIQKGFAVEINDALLVAATEGNLEIAESLVQHGADPNNRNENIALPPLFYALEINNQKMLDCLLAIGARLDI